MHPLLFYRPGERLSLAELGAARLDGHVIEVGEGFMPADTVENAAARARSIATLLPSRTAASGPTAAWIHGARDDPPAVHHATRCTVSRLRAHSSARVVYHDHALAPEDVQEIGGIPVTTPRATATTLLFESALAFSDDTWLRGLLSVMPGLGAVVEEHVASIRGRPGIRAARRIIAELRADHEVVTR